MATLRDLYLDVHGKDYRPDDLEGLKTLSRFSGNYLTVRYAESVNATSRALDELETELAIREQLLGESGSC